MVKKKTLNDGLVTKTSEEQTTQLIAPKMTEEEEFDTAAREVMQFRESIKLLEEKLEQHQEALKVQEKALANLLERNVKGKEMTAEWVPTLRRIGRPSPEDLAALEAIDQRLVKRIPGSVMVRVVDEIKLIQAEEALEKMGARIIKEEPRLGPPSVSDVDKVIKERRELWGSQAEIWDRLDLKVNKELKVYPTLLGTVEEQ